MRRWASAEPTGSPREAAMVAFSLGYRRAHYHLREQGWEINPKRVQRLWRDEGLRVPVRTRKRRRLGDSTTPAKRLRAEHQDHVWAFDFQADRTADGRTLRLCNIVDEFIREALVMLVARSIDTDTVVAELEGLVAERGAPEHPRMDNGPEMTAHAPVDWCTLSGTGRRTSTRAHRGRTPTRVLPLPGARRAAGHRGVLLSRRGPGRDRRSPSVSPQTISAP